MTQDERAAVMEQVVVQNDLSKLSAAQRVSYYRQKCESMGLDWTRQPMQYITLQGKLTLYLTAAGTSQLRSVNRIDIDAPAVQQVGDLYVVTVQGRLPSGRTDTEMGAVNVAGLRGEALANAMMKAFTKAKRRLTISLTGAGLLDESEVDSVPGAKTVQVTERGELVERAPVPALAPPMQDDAEQGEGAATEDYNPVGNYLQQVQGAQTVSEFDKLRRQFRAELKQAGIELSDDEALIVREADVESLAGGRRCRTVAAAAGPQEHQP
jgi:hypothetical protein